MEKYELFHSAENIVVIRSKGEKIIEKKSKYINSMYLVETTWKGNKNAKFSYYSGVLAINKMGSKDFDNSVLELEKVDKGNTLFLVFDVDGASFCRLLYLNEKGRLKFLLHRKPNISIPNHDLFGTSGDELNELNIHITLNVLKTHVDLLLFNKKDQKKKLKELRDLSPLKNESIAISSLLFGRKYNSYTFEDFQKSYKYDYKLHYKLSSLNSFKSDNSRYYIVPISYYNSIANSTTSYNSSNNSSSTSTSYTSYLTCNLCIYDKKNKVFINIHGNYYVTKKTVKGLKKKVK